MKILYVTTVGTTMNFFNIFIRKLLDEGHEVHIATNQGISKVPDCYVNWGCKIYSLSCSRSPLRLGNIKAINQIKNIVEENSYDIVHCHTPIAAMCTRLACIKARRKGMRVIYTAHGFHFYKGAPLKNWILYYPIERLCGRLTDILITINKEDYYFAKKKRLAKKVEYIPGVGVDIDKVKDISVDVNAKRKEINIKDNKIMLLSVGELNENKNHETVIRAIKDIENIHYVIAGKGKLQQHLEDIIEELCLLDRVSLLGQRKDVIELCKTADVFISSSIREGLPVSVMEAMASSLPCVVTEIRGNTDLIDKNGGMYFQPGNVNDCKRAIEEILASDLVGMGKYNETKVKS